MPTELVSRIDLDLIYPPFLERFLGVLAECRARGVVYVATQGYRTPEEQMALWRKGRNESGVVVRHSQVVTKTRFGAHCAGVAVDCVRDLDLAKAGVQPGWRLEHYDALAEEAERVGLEAGRRWKGFPDGPHVQLPLRDRRISLKTLEDIHAKDGLLGVWAYLDTKGPW